MSGVKLPAALLARRKKLEAEHGDGAAPAAPAAQPEEPAPEASADLLTAAEDDGEEDLSPAAEPGDFIAGLENLFSTDAGGPAPQPEAEPPAEDRQASEWAKERQRLLEEKQELQDRLAAAERGSAPTPASITAPEADATLLSNYRTARPAIEHIAVAAVASQINPLLEAVVARVAALEKSAETTTRAATTATERTTRMMESSFRTALANEFGDISGILSSKQFQAFLSRRPQYMPDTTLRELLGQATKARNAQQVIRIIRAFAKTEEARGNKIDGLRQRQPGAGRGAAAQNELPNSGNSGKLKFSERQQAWDDFRSGRISREKFDEIKVKFEAADKQGNVDYSS